MHFLSPKKHAAAPVARGKAGADPRRGCRGSQTPRRRGGLCVSLCVDACVCVCRKWMSGRGRACAARASLRDGGACASCVSSCIRLLALSLCTRLLALSFCMRLLALSLCMRLLVVSLCMRLLVVLHASPCCASGVVLLGSLCCVCQSGRPVAGGIVCEWTSGSECSGRPGGLCESECSGRPVAGGLV